MPASLQGKDRADLLFALPNPFQPFIVRDHGQKTHVTHHVNKTREYELCKKKRGRIYKVSHPMVHGYQENTMNL